MIPRPDLSNPTHMRVILAAAALIAAVVVTALFRGFGGSGDAPRADAPPAKPKGGDEAAKAERIAKLRAGAEAARKRKADAKAKPPAEGGAA